MFKKFINSTAMSVVGSVAILSVVLFQILDLIKDSKADLRDYANDVSGVSEKYNEFVNKHADQHVELINELKKRDLKVVRYTKEELTALNSKIDDLLDALYDKRLLTFKEVRLLEKEDSVLKDNEGLDSE